MLYLFKPGLRMQLPFLVIVILLAADVATAAEEWETSYIELQSFDTVEISGPLALHINSTGSGTPCTRLKQHAPVAFAGNLQAEVTNGKLTLKFPPDPALPSWVDLSIYCPGVKSITAGDYSYVLQGTVSAEHLTLRSNKGYIAAVGNARKVEARIESEGYIALERLSVQSAQLETLGGGMIAITDPAGFAAKTQDGGKIIIFQEALPKVEHQTEISPGVFLQSSRYRLQEDQRYALQYTYFDRVRKRMTGGGRAN